MEFPSQAIVLAAENPPTTGRLNCDEKTPTHLKHVKIRAVQGGVGLWYIRTTVTL